ncbi:4-phosphopantoate--beta-alanine ligase [uncultured archaeon]|nr:4-phosphopantoate--beta-alanine ligase [uncultured archaeon]
MEVPDDHPRKASLEVRHLLTDGFKAGLVAEAGLIAHGRGEAFDYLLGERTHPFADRACRAAAALLVLAKNPVFSVNGNVAALCPKEVVALSEAADAEIEVNLFYRTREREEAIAKKLTDSGAKNVYGIGASTRLLGLSSPRALIDKALKNADVVIVPLEDGDRTEALRKAGKKVIAIDLNPLSRTAQTADVTIVDNVVRCMPLMVRHAKALHGKTDEADKIIRSYDNKKTLIEAETTIRKGARPA